MTHKTTNLIAEITEDHPIFLAALSQYDGVKTYQVKQTIMKMVKATVEATVNHIDRK